MNLCKFEMDLVCTPIPDYPFPHLREIVNSAKILLNSRSNQEINAASTYLELMIDYYFNNELTNGIDLSCQRYEQEISTRENTSELDALKNAIGNFDLNNPEFENAKEYEYFAVLGLWLALDAIDWLYLDKDNAKNIPINLPLMNNELSINGTQDIEKVRLAGIRTIEAMDAVCHANSFATADALAEEMTTKKLKSRGLQGVHKKNEKYGELIKYAEMLFVKKEWHSVMQASKVIFPEVQKYAKEKGIKLLSDDNGEKTVYTWLLKHEKETKDTLGWP